MTIGAMNNPIRDPIEEIELISQENFDFVDYTFEPPLADKLDPTVLRDKLKDCNLSIIGHTDPHLPAIYPNARIRDLCLKELFHAVDFFATAGAAKMSIHPYNTKANLPLDQKILANEKIIAALIPKCQQKNISLLIENVSYPYNHPELYFSWAEQFPEVKFHFDIGHANIQNDPIEITKKFFDNLKDRIEHVHIHDNNGERDEHLTLGCGNIDWQNIFELLKKYHYNKTVTLEIFCKNDQYRLISREITLSLYYHQKFPRIV